MKRLRPPVRGMMGRGRREWPGLLDMRDRGLSVGMDDPSEEVSEDMDTRMGMAFKVKPPGSRKLGQVKGRQRFNFHL